MNHLSAGVKGSFISPKLRCCSFFLELSPPGRVSDRISGSLVGIFAARRQNKTNGDVCSQHLQLESMGANPGHQPALMIPTCPLHVLHAVSPNACSPSRASRAELEPAGAAGGGAPPPGARLAA